jgi:hypothetical protein
VIGGCRGSAAVLVLAAPGRVEAEGEDSDGIGAVVREASAGRSRGIITGLPPCLAVCGIRLPVNHRTR